MSIKDRICSIFLKQIGINYMYSIPISKYQEGSDTDTLSLSLSYESIGLISGNIFNTLSKLKELDLYFNDLKFLPEEIFNNLINLEKLDLSYNQLITVPKIYLIMF